MVHPLDAHHIASGRYNQPNRYRIRRHAHWLQCVVPIHSIYTACSLTFSPSAWLFELAGGAIGDSENSCLPKEQRDATFNVTALHQWDLGIDDPKCVYTAEDVSDPLAPPLWFDV